MSRLVNAPGVLGVFGKLKIKPAGETVVAALLKAVVLTEPGRNLTYDPADADSTEQPAVHVEPIESPEQVEELHSGYIVKGKWNRKLLAKLIETMSDWQESAGRGWLHWRSGWYDGRAERHVRNAMELLAQCEQLPADAPELKRLVRRVRRSVAVKKWRRLRKCYLGFGDSEPKDDRVSTL